MQNKDHDSGGFKFFDRDLSWLSFNERVLLEAKNEAVPLLERINFLSIFSSNLDEFYRVRMPALAAVNKLNQKLKSNKKNIIKQSDVFDSVVKSIHQHQDLFGQIFKEVRLSLAANNVVLLYGEPIPEAIKPAIKHYFLSQVMGFLKPVFLSRENDFFPLNNHLYFAVKGTSDALSKSVAIVNIPTDFLPRFFSVFNEGKQYIVFLDDIIRTHLGMIDGIDPDLVFSFKVTRDAEIDLGDEYQDDIAEQIEKQIAKRDEALATRFLYEPGIAEDILNRLLMRLGLPKKVTVPGGRYHNLRDLDPKIFTLPDSRYPKLPSINSSPQTRSLLDSIAEKDLLLHSPYHSYDTVLQFFNEASINPNVKHIFLTIYRVANDSRILNALLSASHNGKKVTILVELKARFDEANNIAWGKRLKKVGIEVIYSPSRLKVHAKTALLILKHGEKKYRGLLSTGNLNENTACFYTDHILLTSETTILKELKMVFAAFKKGSKSKDDFKFKTLLVAQYNLHDQFLELIDREIRNARQGLPARIIIKLNNLEEHVLITKLYEASNAGVKIDLIVRSICCLVPGIAGMSDNISVRRIIDRYLEHGRVFIFHNNGADEIYLGSADWMNRNIYRRIEVCFPVLDMRLKAELLDIINLQLDDNVQAVLVDEHLTNRFVDGAPERIRSQMQIYEYLAKK